MPGKKLDKKTLESYKKRLDKIKEDILHDIKNMSSVNSAIQKDATEDSAGHALHMADVATDMYDREFSLGLASNDRELLSRIESALKRIGNKSYGLCRECAKPIMTA